MFADLRRIRALEMARTPPSHQETTNGYSLSLGGNSCMLAIRAPEPTPNPSKEGNCRCAPDVWLLSLEGLGVG
jgi:hypothetical protein